MKARLWQSLFLLNALMTTEIVFAEDSKKDVRDPKRTKYYVSSLSADGC
jgi:hypothetical protein